MDLSFKLASLLEDLDIGFEVIPIDDVKYSIEFTYDGTFYDVEFVDENNLVVNGEEITYKDFIINTF
jgi:hypothetical protein